MSRHRNVRTMKYEDEYFDEDDVYGHSVEDSYCISPGTAAQFTFNRDSNVDLSSFMEKEGGIPEEDEEEEDEEDGQKQLHNSLDYTRPTLNDVDTAKLNSCLEEIRNVLGESVPESVLVDVIMKNDYQLEVSLNKLLTLQDAPKPKREPRQNRHNRSQEFDDKSLDQSDSPGFGNVTFMSEGRVGGVMKFGSPFEIEGLRLQCAETPSHVQSESLVSTAFGRPPWVGDKSVGKGEIAHTKNKDINMNMANLSEKVRNFVIQDVEQQGQQPSDSRSENVSHLLGVGDSHRSGTVGLGPSGTTPVSVSLTTTDCQLTTKPGKMGQQTKLSLMDIASQHSFKPPTLSLLDLAKQQAVGKGSLENKTSLNSLASGTSNQSKISLMGMAAKNQTSQVQTGSGSTGTSLSDLAKQNQGVGEKGGFSLEKLSLQARSSKMKGPLVPRPSSLGSEYSLPSIKVKEKPIQLSHIAKQDMSSDQNKTSGSSLVALAKQHEVQGPKMAASSGISLSDLAKLHSEGDPSGIVSQLFKNQGLNLSYVTSGSNPGLEREKSDESLSRTQCGTASAATEATKIPLKSLAELSIKSKSKTKKDPKGQSKPGPLSQVFITKSDDNPASEDIPIDKNSEPVQMNLTCDVVISKGSELASSPSRLGNTLCMRFKRKRSLDGDITRPVKKSKFSFAYQMRGVQHVSPIYKRKLVPFDFSTLSPDDVVKRNQKAAFTRTGGNKTRDSEKEAWEI